MVPLGVRLLLAANRILPHPALPGDTDPEAYAQWEYLTSDTVVRLWRSARGAAVHRALDLGCGLGGKTRRLVEESGAAVRWAALDIELDHLRWTRAHHTHHEVAGVDPTAGDAAHLPFADRSFDRIVTADTLEHFPDPRQALREMRRCLHDDGRLLLIFNPWGSPRGSHLGDLLHLPWCQLLFSRDTLEAAALAEAEQRARNAGDAARAEEIRGFGRELVHHFRHHVHATRIGQLRSWLRQDGVFAVEKELHRGPGPLRRLPGLKSPLLEEWLTASYGVVLRPLAAA